MLTDIWADGHTDSSCVLQNVVPFGSAALLTSKADSKKYKSRAWVLLTTFCLWATVSYLLCLLPTKWLPCSATICTPDCCPRQPGVAKVERRVSSRGVDPSEWRDSLGVVVGSPRWSWWVPRVEGRSPLGGVEGSLG